MAEQRDEPYNYSSVKKNVTEKRDAKLSVAQNLSKVLLCGEAEGMGWQLPTARVGTPRRY